MTIDEIDIRALQAVLADGATLIDVRMPDEFESERVPGAVLVPLPELPDRIGEIPETGTVYVICRSGNRSMVACEFMAARGYEVANIAGGTLAWIAADLPIESGPST